MSFFETKDDYGYGGVVRSSYGEPVTTGAGGYLTYGRRLTQKELAEALALGLTIAENQSVIFPDGGMIQVGETALVAVRRETHFALATVQAGIDTPFNVLAQQVNDAVAKAGVPSQIAPMIGTSLANQVRSLIPHIGTVRAGLKLAGELTAEETDGVTVIEYGLQLATTLGVVNPIVPFLFAGALFVKGLLDKRD